MGEDAWDYVGGERGGEEEGWGFFGGDGEDEDEDLGGEAAYS